MYGDVRTFDATAWRGKVGIVTGGFPCQPHSQAGKRLGGKDDRDLWPDTVRILRESRAPLGFFENVPGLLTSRDADGYPMFGRILGDLSEAGFDAEWCVLGADDVGAPHRRKRLWLLAHRQGFTEWPGLCAGEPSEERRGRLGDGGSPWAIDPADIPDRDRAGREERRRTEPSEPKHSAAEYGGEELGDARSCLCNRRTLESRREAQERTTAWRSGEGEPRCELVADPWLAEPCVDGMADGLADWVGGRIPRVAVGVPARVDRLRALGNGQVPITMAAAFTLLARRAGVL
jgi:DNA (cytosine-5)-methyltransferase 1